MKIEGYAMLWPSAQNYRRFRELCADRMKPTYREFVTMADRRLKLFERAGIAVRRVPFDPDRMAAWCLAHAGQVDAHARAAYAAFLASEEDLDRATIQ